MGRKKLTGEEKSEKEEASEKPEIKIEVDEVIKVEEKAEEKKTEKKGKEKDGASETLLVSDSAQKSEISDKKKTDEKKATNTLIPIEDYVKAGCYIGTKVITPDMRKFVYRRRADGIAIINTNVIDQKIGEAAKLIAEYKPEDWILVCKREAGWRAIKLFSELTGVRVFTKKYPAGIITNINLPDFFETKLVFVCDPWLDKNAMNDAVNVKKRIFSICDTNNLARQADFVIPANNKSNKSLGVIFYVLAREYMKSQGITKKLPSMEDFIGEKLGELEPKKNKKVEDEKKKDIEKIEGILRLSEDKEK